MNFRMLRLLEHPALLVLICLIVDSEGHDPHPDADPTEPTNLHPFAKQFVENMKHITSHFAGIAQMKEEDIGQNEARFHYFKQHDFDNNNRLDGLEIMSALRHNAHYEPTTLKFANRPPSEVETLRRQASKDWHYKLERIVDEALKENDINNDGYLSYMEYKKAVTRQLDMLTE